MEHPKFEGHVTLNEDEYKKSVQFEFRYCLEVSYFTVSFFDYMHNGRGDRLRNRSFLQLLDLRDLDCVSGHMA